MVSASSGPSRGSARQETETMAKKKILVCGATGFIGRNILDAFHGNPDLELHGVYCKTKPDDTLRKRSGLTLIQADLRDPGDVERCVPGMDVVIQAAATTSGAKDIVTRPYIHVTDNAVMNALIFRACHQHAVGQVVFFSCTTMYPSSQKPVKEDAFTGRIPDKYFGAGWTKVYNEKMCEFYARLGPTRYTVVRHSNIYGPFDKFDLDRSHVFGATITKVLTAPEHGQVVVWGDGSEVRDLLYVDDLVAFVKQATSTAKDAVRAGQRWGRARDLDSRSGAEDHSSFREEARNCV